MIAVTLSLPPRPESLHVIRSVTTTVAASTDMPLDVVEEFAVAVDEAATMLLTAGGVSQALRVDLVVEGEELRAEVSGDEPSAQWPPPGFEDGFAWRVMSSLTDGPALTDGPQGPRVQLAKKVPNLV